jgi:hypothetical protein
MTEYRLLNFPMTGDIALMNAKFGIVAAQSAARRRIARYSHAAMTVDDEIYIDSLTNRGIGVSYWAELDPAMPIRVFRHRPTAHRSHERIRVMLDHYGKAYNFAMAAKGHPIFRKRFGDAFYCSEFVAAIFSRAELGVDPARRMVMPADLEALADNPDWDDVTAIYWPYIDGTTPPNSKLSGHSFAETFRTAGQTTANVRKMSEKYREFEAEMEQMRKVLADSATTIRNLTRK